jgi:hypothetical protein
MIKSESTNPFLREEIDPITDTVGFIGKDCRVQIRLVPTNETANIFGDIPIISRGVRKDILNTN